MLLPHDRLGGGAPPVVLVPGITGHRSWMAPLAGALAPRHATVAFTLPGEPEAPAAGPDPRRASLDEVAARAEELMDACGMPRAVICGTSFGGLVALHLALTRPGRVLALVLHATTARPDLRLRRYRRLLRFPRLSVLVLNVVLLSEFRAEFRASFPERSRRRRFYLRAAALRLGTPWSPRAIGTRLQEIAALDLTPRLSEIRAPTLVLSGEPGLDRIMLPGEGPRLAAAIPAAEHRTVRGTGHLGTLARPDLVAAEIDRFLSERLPAAAG